MAAFDGRMLARTGLLLAAIVALSWIANWLDTKRPVGLVEGKPRIVDGDSFFIVADEVRLKGIDAPEGRQTCRREQRDWPCGEEARRTLVRLIAGEPVSCRSVEKDEHGRHLAHCTAGGRDLNRAMVEAGFAVAYGGYRAEETRARMAKRGIWSGKFERPRDWRRENMRR